jgi:signal transduction histidine kinase
MAAAFAGHAAVAMELARARADQITLAQAEDHDRIAGDLHDHVIQDLFALGMRLQAYAARCEPAAAERVNGCVDTLDEVIKKIRTSIFGLPGAPGRADHPRHHRQRPRPRYARPLQRPVQHAPPRRT